MVILSVYAQFHHRLHYRRLGRIDSSAPGLTKHNIIYSLARSESSQIDGPTRHQSGRVLVAGGVGAGDASWGWGRVLGLGTAGQSPLVLWLSWGRWPSHHWSCGCHGDGRQVTTRGFHGNGGPVTIGIVTVAPPLPQYHTISSHQKTS